MARKISMSQFKSKLRQIENKQKQAINNYNRSVRNYNSELRKLQDNVNRNISQYNAAVRRYNSSVARNRQIIQREYGLLSSYSMSQHASYSASMSAMQHQYNCVDSVYAEGNPITDRQERIVSLIEQEQANGLITTNVIFNNAVPVENTEDIEIGDKLAKISEDLNNRWKGAVFSLSPHNPDAARHFCTSARELFTEFIESQAPDIKVFEYNPDCQKTDRGNATRKEKIKYMMRNTEIDSSVIEFADKDISNILELFHVLSDGTHGAAGRYEFEKLLQVKKRVEQGINFLCELCA